jgi:inner membrane protein involved in colicin E2 resistance
MLLLRRRRMLLLLQLMLLLVVVVTEIKHERPDTVQSSQVSQGQRKTQQMFTPHHHQKYNQTKQGSDKETEMNKRVEKFKTREREKE